MSVVIDTREEAVQLRQEIERLYKIIDAQAFGYRIKEIVLLYRWYETLGNLVNEVWKHRDELPENVKAIFVACRKQLDVLEQESGLPIKRYKDAVRPES